MKRLAIIGLACALGMTSLSGFAADAKADASKPAATTMQKPMAKPAMKKTHKAKMHHAKKAVHAKKPAASAAK